MRAVEIRYLVKILWLLCVCSLQLPVLANPSTWNPLGPANASVFAITSSPHDPTQLIVGTFFGGLYKSDDSGQNWVHVDSPFSNSTVFSVVYAPDVPGVIYAGTFDAGLYKSDDDGLSWTQLNNGLTDSSIADISIDPNAPSNVLAVTDTSVFRSTDSGVSWSEVDVSAVGVPRVIVHDASNSGHVYLGTLGSGVYRSTDDGLSWTPFNSGMGDRTVSSLEFSSDGATLYAATSDGAFSLVTSGSSWQDISYDLPATLVTQVLQHPIDGRLFVATGSGIFTLDNGEQTWVLWGEVPARQLLIDPAATIIYVATTFSELVATTDDGLTFFSVEQGIQNVFAGALLGVNFEGQTVLYAGLSNGVQVNSDFFTTDGINVWTGDENFNEGVFGITAHPTIDGTAYAGTEKAGVWTSADWGATWTQTSDGLVPPTIFSLSQSPVSTRTLYAGTSTGLYLSRDDGLSWEAEGDISLSLSTLAVKADPVSEGVAYISVPGGVYKTINDGQSFQLANIGLPAGEQIRHLAIAPFGNVYAVGTSGSVFASNDEGSSWFATGSEIEHAVVEIATDPVLPWKAYAATVDGGVYRTVNSAITWEAINVGLTTPFVFSVAVDRNDGLTLYAGSVGVVFKSIDGGENWQGNSSGLPASAQITAIAVDPNNSNSLVANLGDEGIYTSLDGGITWQLGVSGEPYVGVQPILFSEQEAGKILSGSAFEGVHASVNDAASFAPSSTGMSLFVRSIAVDASNPQIMYAASLVGGLFKSVDGAQSWQNMGLSDRNLFKVEIAPDNSNQIFLATSRGIMRSSDGGLNWFDLGQRSALAFSLAVDPTDRDHFFIGSPAGEVFRTQDGGDSWSDAHMGLPIANILALVVDPSAGRIYASAENIGVYTSTDNGMSWNSTGELPAGVKVSSLSVSPEGGRVFAATNGDGLFVSDDNGQNWLLKGLEDREQIFNLSFDAQNSNLIRASTSLGLVQSPDGGDSWFELGQQSPFVFDVLTDPQNRQIIYVAGAAGEVFKSIDGGTSWTKINTGLPAANILALALHSSSGMLYAGSESQGVFRSTDGGLNWLPTSQTINSEQITSLAINESTGQVFVGTNGGGVYSSSDNGATWVVSTAGLDSLIVSDIVIDPAVNDRLYVTTQSNTVGDAGIYVSTDGGLTWQASATGVTSAGVNDLALLPTAANILYVATDDGVFRSVDSGASWVSNSAGLNGISILAVTIDPVTPARLLAVGSDQRVYLSEDSGNAWSQSTMNGIGEDIRGTRIGTNARRFAHTLGGGVLVSDDSGASWHAALVPGMVNEIAKTVINDPANNQILYAAFENLGIVKTEDAGGRWSLINSALAASTINELYVNPDNSQQLLAGTATNGVFRSVDGGSSWSGVIDAYGGFNVSEFSAGQSSNSVIAASIDYGLLRSQDAGANWSDGVLGSQAEPLVSEMVVHPTDADIVYAAASGVGLLKSVDGGVNWALVSASFGNQFILALVIDPQQPDTVYAGTGDGVYVTEDGGVSWTLLSDGLFNTNITALTLDPNNSRIVYVGTEGGGVFSLDRSLPAIDSDGDFVADADDCAPNDPAIASLHAFFHDYEQDSFGINRVEPMIPPDFFIETAIDICSLTPPNGLVAFTGDPWDFDGFQFIETVDKTLRNVAVDFSALPEDGIFSDDRLVDLGVDATTAHLNWRDLESSPGVYQGAQAAVLQAINSVYGARDLKLSLTISPISGRFLTIPADLQTDILTGSVRMNDAIVIDRFKALLDHVHSELSDIDVLSIQLGHELDEFVSEVTVPGFWTDYGEFYEAVFIHAKTLWGMDMPVSTTFTSDGFVDADFAPLLQIFQLYDDVVSLTFFPRRDDHTIYEPEDIKGLLTSIVDAAAALSKPIFIQAMGYPTAPATGSSTTKQSQFLFEFFTFWDERHTEIPFASIGPLHDIPFELAEAQVDAGLIDTAADLGDELERKRVAAYLSSLGFRTYNGSGAHKPGFNTLRNMIFDRGWFRDVPQDSRRYLMGFTTAGYDFPTEPAEQIVVTDWLVNRLRSDSDITLLHFDGGVPWVEAFADDFSSTELPYSEAVKGVFLQNRDVVPAGSKVAVSVNPLGVPRNLLAPYWGYGEGFDFDEDFNRIPNGAFADDERRYPPPPWDTYKFSDPQVKTAYLNYCKRILQYFDPDYLILGIEVSAALIHDTEDYEEYFELHRYVYDSLKSDPEYAHIPLMVSFSVTSYMIDEFGVAYKFDEQEPGVRQAQIDALQNFLPYTDIIGLSYYPHFGKYSAYTMPSMLYDEFFELLDSMGASDKPLAFTESGFTADPYDILDGFVYEGSEDKQFRYFKLLFRELARRSNPVEFLINFKIRDSDLGWQRQVDALDPDAPEGTSNFVEFLKFFRDIGIYDGLGQLRSGGQVWLDQLALPLLPEVDPVDKITVASPAGELEASFEMGVTRRPYFTLSKGGRNLLAMSSLGLEVDGVNLSYLGDSITSTEPVTVTDSFTVLGANNYADETYTAFTLTINRNDPAMPAFDIDVRLYESAVAYRYRIPGVGPRLVSGEETAWSIPSGSVIWGQNDLGIHQGEIQGNTLNNIPAPFALPITASLADGGYLVVTEADLEDYSGMVVSLENLGSRVLASQFPFDQSWSVDGGSASPWRVVYYSDDLNGLVNSNVVASLNSAPDPLLFDQGPYSNWIKPGQALWPGWLTSGTGFDFNTQLGQVWQAANLGFEYLMIDPGWETGFQFGGFPDAFSALSALTNYAQSDGRDVGIIVWKDIQELYDPIVRQFFLQAIAGAGAAGVRVDFVNNESQQRLEVMEDIRQEAAALQLLVTFENVAKPTGENRSYPNEMARTAVRGLDWVGGVDEVTPAHNTAIPFTRGLVGATDYKVVGLNDGNQGDTSFMHQLAMAGILVSPLQTWAASPADIQAQPDAFDVITALPTIWDETRVLEPSEIGDLVVMARRRHDRWFLFVANGNTGGARTLDNIDLSFMGTNYYNAVLLGDKSSTGIRRHEERHIGRNYPLTITMEPGGGFVAMFSKVNTRNKFRTREFRDETVQRQK